MYSVIKFQSPFERLKQYNSSSEIILYKAIITQAIIDATNISETPKARVIERDAKAWIFGNSDHFQKICYMAEIEPGFVVKITKEAIKLNCKKVGFSKKKSKRILVDYKISPVETKNSYAKLLV
jgi:hypothetical protein